jgi:hypothetical protein
MQVFGNMLQDVGLGKFFSRTGRQYFTHLLETYFIFNSIFVESFITDELLPCLAYFTTVSKTLVVQRIQNLFSQMRKPSNMAIPVVEFSREVYKIEKIFG